MDKTKALQTESVKQIASIYNRKENEFKDSKGKGIKDTELIAITANLAKALHNIMVRRTSDSHWFGEHLEPPVPHTDVNHPIPFPTL